MAKTMLKKLAGAVVLAAMALQSVSVFAQEAAMTFSIPSETLAELNIPTDDDEKMEVLLNSLNGVGSDGESVERSSDLCGWKIIRHNTNRNWTNEIHHKNDSAGKYLSLGIINDPAIARISNNEMISGLDQPFELSYDAALEYHLEVYVGQVKSFGDEEDDYYKIYYRYDGANNKNIAELTRVTSDGVIATDTKERGYYLLLKGKMSYDGKNLTVGDSNIADSAYQLKLENTEPVTKGKVYINTPQNGCVALKSVKLERPSTKKSVNNFYLGLNNFTAGDISMSALNNAGWYAVSDDGNSVLDVDANKGNALKLNGNSASLRYDGAEFSGDYTINLKAFVGYNNINYYFNYKDSDNYYRLYQSGVEQNNPVKLFKVYNGTEIPIATGIRPNYPIDSSTKIKLTNNTDGSLTIDITGITNDNNGEFTYTDSDNPIKGGKIYISTQWGGSLKVNYINVYPTAYAENPSDITFDVYVNGEKAEGDTIAKGAVSIGMPKKYAGLQNKVIAVLYDNYQMKNIKVMEASDFWSKDSIEVFDTTDCSDNAEMSIMMWNSFGEIRPILKNAVKKTIK